MTFNGPPRTSAEKDPVQVEIPPYWKENPPFKSPREYFELQFAFAKLMAAREGISLVEAVEKYAPVIQKATHELKDGGEGQALPGVTDENMLEVAWATSLDRRSILNSEPTPYYSEKDSRFGCHSFDYEEDTKTVRIHFTNAEFEEQWEDGKDISCGPLSKEKIESRKHELSQMFRFIKEKYPDAEHVRGCSNLYNLDAYRRLYPDTYEVGDIDYSQKRWKQGMSIWGQFLGGKEKEPGQYGFKQELAEEFLEKAKTVPLDRLADALPNPPRRAHGPIEDFYRFYGI